MSQSSLQELLRPIPQMRLLTDQELAPLKDSSHLNQAFFGNLGIYKEEYVKGKLGWKKLDWLPLRSDASFSRKVLISVVPPPACDEHLPSHNRHALGSAGHLMAYLAAVGLVRIPIVAMGPFMHYKDKCILYWGYTQGDTYRLHLIRYDTTNQALRGLVTTANLLMWDTLR